MEDNPKVLPLLEALVRGVLTKLEFAPKIMGAEAPIQLIEDRSVGCGHLVNAALQSVTDGLLCVGVQLADEVQHRTPALYQDETQSNQSSQKEAGSDPEPTGPEAGCQPRCGLPVGTWEAEAADAGGQVHGASGMAPR